MAERFNTDLPSSFRFREKEQEKKDGELEDYLSSLVRHIDETLRRVFNRLSEPVSRTIHTLLNNATPSVEGGRIYLTGGTTTITDFDDGVEGQEIIIISEHAVTITDGTNIFLSGSGNFVMAATDTLTLVCKADNKWYEIGRSDNT